MLVVAAIGRELARLARDPRPEIELIETGEGPRNAARALRSRLEHGSPRAVINIGLAGALSPGLKAGETLIAREARAGSESFNAACSPLFQPASLLKHLRPGVAITLDEIVCLAQSKRRLSGRLAPGELGWVDMESAAVASVCIEKRIPFLILRAISDTFDEDLPIDFNRCRDGDGRVSNGKVIRAALARPGAFRGLMRLRQRADVCSERLAAAVRELLPLIPS